MKNILLASVFIALLALSTSQPYGGDYDYTIFASQWAGTVCKMEKCQKTSSINSKFYNIKGFWPMKVGKSIESFQKCNEFSFHMDDLIDQTKQDLIKYWNALTVSKSEDLYQSEWDLHGTCWTDPAFERLQTQKKGDLSDVSFDKSDFEDLLITFEESDLEETELITIPSPNRVQDYFSKAIETAKSIHLYGVMKKGGFGPSDKKGYQLKDIQKLLNKEVKKNSYTLSCQFDKSEDKQYLDTIFICLDLDYQPFECKNSSFSMGCDSNLKIYIPKI